MEFIIHILAAVPSRGGLLHGSHNVRDVLATHILKQTGSYEQASYAIQDTPEMVQQHYVPRKTLRYAAFAFRRLRGII